MSGGDDSFAWTQLEVEGDLDARTGPALLFACRREVEAGRIHIVVDLARAERVDSRGLGFLVRCCHEARRRGGEVALRRVPEPWLRVLEFTRLDGVFPILGHPLPPVDGPLTEAA